MLLQFCDKCGRPLSEGCLARGEAIERKGELVCSSCIATEQNRSAVRAAEAETGQETTGPLGHYEQAVWSCQSCGIPVTALDLIEGRGSRIGGVLKCSRCAPITEDTPVAAKPEIPAAPVAKPRPVPPARRELPRKAPSLPRGAAVTSTPRHASTAATEFMADVKSEQRRPVLPILMFAIVLPMFAVSVYFAVSSQQKLNEVMSGQANSEPAPDRRNRRPNERLQPDIGDNRPPVNRQPEGEPPVANQPEDNPPSETSTPLPLPPEVVNDLVNVENDLASAAVKKLQSKDLGKVWEALIEVGSRRLIAARPYVRALLRDQDDNTRALACRVAGMLDDAEALPTLTRMVELDPSESVRIEARKAHDRMTGEATRELRDLTREELKKMLEDIKRELERRGRND